MQNKVQNISCYGKERGNEKFLGVFPYLKNSRFFHFKLLHKNIWELTHIKDIITLPANIYSEDRRKPA